MKRLPFCQAQHESAKRLCALWLCDPSKNKQCAKTNCGQIFDFESGESKGLCRGTSKKRFAQRGIDGKPIPIYKDLFSFYDMQRFLINNLNSYRIMEQMKKGEKKCQENKNEQ